MKPDLKQLVTYWQRKLRLLDWRIAAEYVRDLCTKGGDPLYGLCSPLVDNKTARIWIRDPETPVDDGCDPNAKAEEAVVHELVHLHFAAFGTRTPAEIAAEEQAVWALAEALCTAKGTPREEQLTRAMLAQVKASAVTRMARRNDMDFAMFIAALEAALEAQDPKAAIQALLEKVKATAGGGGDAAGGEPPMTQQAEEDPEKQPVAARAARATTPSRITVPMAQPDVLTALRGMVGEALAPFTKDLDAMKRDQLLEMRGHVLSDEQLRWARTQPYVTVKGLLDATPEPADEEPRRPRAARGTSPTRGASAGGGIVTSINLVDRAMRVEPDDEPAVTIDPSTNKLMISHRRPINLRPASGEKGRV